MVNQKIGVKNVVLSFFSDYELGGEVILASLLNADIKKQMRVALAEGFRAGEISMSEAAQAKYLNNTEALNPRRTRRWLPLRASRERPG